MSEPTIDFASKPATEQAPVALPGIQSAYLGPANSASATASGGGGGTRNTTLPGSPVDGQVATLTDSLATPTYNWDFAWSTAASAWLFIGGAPALVEVATSETTTSATYAALATAGPSFTVPRAGTYRVRTGMETNGSTTQNILMSYDIGGTGAVDADAIQVTTTTGGFWFSCSRVRSKAGIAAATALVSKYKTSAGTATIRSRWIEVLPVSVT